MEGQKTPLMTAFPHLPANVAELLKKAREQNLDVIHIREQDLKDKSKWLPWWDRLHPPGGVGFGSLGEPEPWAKEIEGEVVFVKHTYDAFLSGVVSERLLAHLKEREIGRIFFAGALTKACVMFTANSAFTHGFEVCVISDCCADRSKEDHDAALNLYNGYHIEVLGLPGALSAMGC